MDQRVKGVMQGASERAEIQQGGEGERPAGKGEIEGRLVGVKHKSRTCVFGWKGE